MDQLCPPPRPPLDKTHLYDNTVLRRFLKSPTHPEAAAAPMFPLTHRSSRWRSREAKKAATDPFKVRALTSATNKSSDLITVRNDPSQTACPAGTRLPDVMKFSLQILGQNSRVDWEGTDMSYTFQYFPPKKLYYLLILVAALQVPCDLCHRIDSWPC